MIRPSSRLFLRGLFTIAALAAPQALAADEPAAKDAEQSPAPLELVIDPAPEPVPALKYHLLVPAEEQVSGNAAPIYGRIAHERSDAWRTKLREFSTLLDVPADQLPLDKARELLKRFGSVPEQLSAAARRSHADWQYVTEGEDPVMILLPDAQFMRNYARLLALKTRYDVRTGDPAAAIVSMRDGLALGQHVADAPFLVNQFIGIAASSIMLAEFDAYAAAPKAPNLYWALAELPRPLISLRRGAATECEILEMKFPELARLDDPLLTPNWERLSRDMRAWALQLAKGEESGNVALLARIQSTPNAEQLAEARAYLRDKRGLPAERVEAMSVPEVEVRFTVALFRDVGDAWRKWLVIPYPQSLPDFKGRGELLLEECKRLELIPLVSVLTPLGGNLLVAQAKLDLNVARAQAIEALRMHAAAIGKLPETLGEVTIVPVPLDPVTGGPFAYTLDGDVAILDVTDTGGIARDLVGLPVRLRLRQK